MRDFALLDGYLKEIYIDSCQGLGASAYFSLIFCEFDGNFCLTFHESKLNGSQV